MQELRMTPVKNAVGERFYIGVGCWNLVWEDGLGPSLSSLLSNISQIYSKSGVRCVAGDCECDNPAEGCRCRLGLPGEIREVTDNETISLAPGFLGWLQKRNAAASILSCGVRNLAGGGFEPPTFGL